MRQIDLMKLNPIFKIMVCVLPLVCIVACFKRSEAPSVEKVVLSYSLEKAIQEENVVPVVIVGSGPAGLSASLYIARAGMKSFVFAGPMPCGQLTQTTFIENWPGRDRVMGLDLMNDIKMQAQSFGATIIHDIVTDIDFKSWPFTLKTEEGKTFKALAVILATGATPRTLNIPGEKEYWGKGVTTCAVCDAGFFKNKEVVVSGGGDSAIEMVFELVPYVKKVTVLVRKGSMRAALAGQKKIQEFPNAVVEYHKEIHQIYGNGQSVVAIDVYDNETKTTEKRAIDGVFLAIGHDPNNKMLHGGVELDEHGYVVMQGRSQETSVHGVFAAGELQDPSYRQAIVAAGEGVKAALDTASFLYDIGFSVATGVTLEQNFFEHFSDVKKELQEISTVQELNQYVLNAKGVVVLDFYAVNCPCCVRMLPYLEAVAHKLEDRARIIKANFPIVKNTIHRELVFVHNIEAKSLPSLLVFKDGKLQDINTKVMNKVEIYNYIQQFCDK